jgi:secreted trypsin-like serine protease
VRGIPPSKFADIISTVDEETEFAPHNKRAYTTGWGDTDPGGGTSYPTELREVDVRIVKRAICNGPDSYDGLITSRMICAGYAAGGKDSCQGDSGGPLVVKNAAGKWRLQVGVVSWGFGCAAPDFYGVYSRLAVLGQWVLNQID